MAIKLQRILIDDSGSTRVFYTRDDGPSGSLTAELKGTPELDALLAKIGAAAEAKIGETEEQREAARAARLGSRSR